MLDSNGLSDSTGRYLFGLPRGKFDFFGTQGAYNFHSYANEFSFLQNAAFK